VPERLLDVVRMQYRPVIERMPELIGRDCLSLARMAWSAIFRELSRKRPGTRPLRAWLDQDLCLIAGLSGPAAVIWAN